VEKILVLLGPARLTLGADGTVHFGNKEWRADADGFYSSADGSDHLMFLTGPDGQRYVGTDNTTYQLLGPASRLTVNLWILGFIAVVALSGLAVLITALVRRRSPSMWRAARLLGAGAAVVGLAFLVLLLVALLGDVSDYIYGAPVRFSVLFVLPLLALAMGAASIGATVVSWRSSGAGVVARVHQVVVLVGLVALTWFVWQWNLIGWRF
jgi:hypothetical protein